MLKKTEEKMFEVKCIYWCSFLAFLWVWEGGERGRGGGKLFLKASEDFIKKKTKSEYCSVLPSFFFFLFVYLAKKKKKR